MLKTLKILFFFIVLFNINAIGQKNNFNYEQPNYNIGIELGPNITNFTKSNMYEGVSTYYKYKMGYSFGGIFQYNLNPYFSFLTNIIYEEVSQYSYINNEYEYNPDQFTYSYLTVPLLTKLNIIKNRFFIEAGPCMGIYICDKYKWWNYLSNEFETPKKADYSSYRRLIFGMEAGMGANIPFGKKYTMSFEARDNYGLTHIVKGNVLPDGKKNRTSLNSIAFLYSITYHIKDKKK